ncbi:trna (uracil-5-)-methyltransferase, partial [Cystoisospora suis]
MQAGGSPGASCLSAGSIYHCLPILGLLCATSVVLAPFIAGFRLSGFGSLNSSLPSCSDWQQTPGADPRNTLHPLSSRRIPASLWVPSLSASRTIVDLAQPCAARTSCTPDAASPLKSDERHHREARHTCSERDGADVGTPLKWRCPSAGDLLLVHVQSILETGEGLATFCLEHTRCACERCHDSGSCEVVCSGSDNADQRNGNSESLRSPDCAASNAFQSRPRENRKRRRNKGSGYPVLQPKKPRWPLFVPFSVPGEHVWVKVRETRAHYSIAFVAAFVAEPSPARVRPRCPYFGSCNGCQYQHMNRSMQHKIKRQHVQNVLRRLGGLGATAPSVNPLIGVKDKKDSEEENLYFYRSKITPHYNFYESGSFPAVGFNDICSPNK